MGQAGVLRNCIWADRIARGTHARQMNKGQYYDQAQAMYLDDSGDRNSCAWTSLVKTEATVSVYQRFCRWNDPRYQADGPENSPIVNQLWPLEFINAAKRICLNLSTLSLLR